MTTDIYNLSFPHAFFEDEVREGFFVPGMMKRLWAGNLKVLSVIATICKKHDIPWFVICGTLLGAVRHGGFVPWDDDLDIIMKRNDLQRFLEIAPSEIPDTYELCNVQTDPHQENSIARLINWKDLTGDIVKEFYGCPYTCGIDLFSLDGRYPDEEQERKRRERFYDILVAIKHVTLHTTQTEICQNLIKKIEKENNCHIIQDELMYGRLCAVINRLYREVPLTEGAEGELFHGIDDHLVFHTDWFHDMVWMPFEHIRLPVPAGYAEVLRVNYGDFMQVKRGGAAHDYPIYANQEKEMKQLMGHNPFRYTFNPAHLQPCQRQSFRNRANEMMTVLFAAGEKISTCREAGDETSAVQLEEASRALKVSVLGMVDPMNRYVADDLSVRGLEELVNTRHVLFLVIRASWWKHFSAIYEEECKKARTYTVVGVIPWYELETDLTTGKKHDDCGAFPDTLHAVSVDMLNFNTQIWDAIYIQFPFDETNQALRIDKEYTAEALRGLTDRLVYVPCFNPAVPEEYDEQGRKALRNLVEQPAVVYADEVLLPSENMRRLYIDIMTDIAGADTAVIWESKMKVCGGTGDV